LRKFFQFARVFQEKNAKTPPKFSRPYKKILKPLPQKISGYAPVATRLSYHSVALKNPQKIAVILLIDMRINGLLLNLPIVY